ncbi:MAG: hypothetical protein L0Z50_37870 [Verrucomicrobiales bacterium]|nr:hypothetical protein [Verrucomicrobiales bacterium]
MKLKSLPLLTVVAWAALTVSRYLHLNPVRVGRLGLDKKLTARQGDKSVPVHIEYDKAIWSGLSWAVGELKNGTFTPGQPLTIRCSSAEKKDFQLKGELYAVTYGQ